MLVFPQKIKTKWNYKNKKWYESKGYSYTKYNDVICVDIEDLVLTSKEEVEYYCDYCLEEGIKTKYKKTYNDYNKAKENCFIQKDCCRKCSSRKMLESATFKQNNGLLQKGDPYYWYFRENRLYELRIYLEKNKTMDNMRNNEHGFLIWHNITNKYKDDIEKMLRELGYSLNEVKKYKPRGYFENIENVNSLLNKLIKKYSRFPTIYELIKEGMSQHQIDKYGGMYELKRLMNYNDECDLVDDRGWYNKSSYEYIVAQFLIHNNISYKREQSPFPEFESNFRSDFTLYLENEQQIHIEVWGFDDKRDDNLVDNYNDRRRRKEELYLKYKIKLISLDKEVFNDSYELINKKLYMIFSDYLNLKYKQVDVDIFVNPSKMKDDELLQKIMTYSDNPDCLPKSSTRDVGFHSIYSEVIKRFGSYRNFALKFNKKTKRKIGTCYKDESIRISFLNDIN